MNSSDLLGGAAVPLLEALPWAPESCPRTFLINDSMGTDGRFLLYSLAFQASTNPILWLAGSPVTSVQIQQGLKRIGCTSAASTNFTIRSLTEEVAKALLENENFNEKVFVQQLYRSIQDWIDSNCSKATPWIILDDVSALANLLGESLIFNLILALNSKSLDPNRGFGLLIRCSNDQEPESLPTFAGTSVGQNQGSFGASTIATPNGATPWEPCLLEIADALLDVLPLTSGYTRELQGRIILTPCPLGRGWQDQDSNQQQPGQIINYGITDQKVMAYVM